MSRYLEQMIPHLLGGISKQPLYLKSLNAGYLYTMHYTFPPFVPRREQTVGQAVSISDGILLMRYMSVTFENTESFSATVETKGQVLGQYTFGPE